MFARFLFRDRVENGWVMGMGVWQPSSRFSIMKPVTACCPSRERQGCFRSLNGKERYCSCCRTRLKQKKANSDGKEALSGFFFA